MSGEWFHLRCRRWPSGRWEAEVGCVWWFALALLLLAAVPFIVAVVVT